MQETFTKEYLEERRKAKRISFTFPTKTLTGVIGETLNLSASGVCLALERPFFSTQTIQIQIDFPFSLPLQTYVEIIWRKPQAQNHRFLCGVKFLKLHKKNAQILKEALEQYTTLNAEFVFLTERMRDWLTEFKIKCDQFDAMYADRFKQIDFIEKNWADVKNILNQHFKAVGRLIENFNPKEYLLHQKYYQNMLWPLLKDHVEINRFITSKPFGYAGDFKIMNYFYDYHYQYLGESSYEKIINFYTCNIPIAFSVIERKNFFKEKIEELLKDPDKDIVKILSVASGSCRELIELAEEEKINKPLYFDCLDLESEAFDDIKNRLNKIDRQNKRYLNIRFNNENFLFLIKEKNVLNIFEEYDLIYSAGLFDYLNERLAKKLIASMFRLLDQDGTLCITNVKKDPDYQPYYTMLGEWKLIHRSADEVLALREEIKETNYAKLIRLETKEPFMFWILTLRKNLVEPF